MAMISGLRCTICRADYAPDDLEYTCPDCGEAGTLDVLYDYTALRADLDRDAIANQGENSMWRWRDLLPLAADSAVPPLRTGGTPLYETQRLAESLDVSSVWVKDDGLNPTGSLKDRASAMIVARAMECDIDIVTTASTGNAAAALAGLGASVGLRTIIFVPASAPEAKIAQLLVYGAEVLLIEDTYDVAFDLCLKASVEAGWYCRNTGINPYTTEGKKTVAYEIAAGLDWNVPDVVIVSVGDGSIIGGVHKGFTELAKLGWISRIPRLIGVQSKGSNPLVRAWENGIDAAAMEPVEASSIADSIVAELPRDRAKALRAVRDSGGAFVAVSDEAILAAIPHFARQTGVFAEPAAAASLAGAQRARETGLIHSEDRVVIISTGNGLKDVAHARQSVGEGRRVAPELAAIMRALND